MEVLVEVNKTRRMVRPSNRTVRLGNEDKENKPEAADRTLRLAGRKVRRDPGV